MPCRNSVVSEEVAGKCFGAMLQYYKTPLILCFPPEIIAVAAVMEVMQLKAVGELSGYAASELANPSTDALCLGTFSRFL